MIERISAAEPMRLVQLKAYLRQQASYASQSVEAIRSGLERQAQLAPLPTGIAWSETDSGFPGEWALPTEASEKPEKPGNAALLYFHGGGFIAGSSRVYRNLTSRLALAAGVRLFTPDYRLAPEHLYPAANEDALAAYRSLLDQGIPPERIVLGGDSVGATLALMTLLRLRDDRSPLPAGAFLISPHADLVHLDGESYESNAASDPTSSREANERILADYWGRTNPEPDSGYAPILSPLRLDLSGLPPLFIQAGGDEVLLDDAVRLAQRADTAEVPVRLQIWEGLWCSFQALAPMLPEAEAAIRGIAAFVRERLA